MNYDIHDTTDYKSALNDCRSKVDIIATWPCSWFSVSKLAAMADIGLLDVLLLTNTVARQWLLDNGFESSSWSETRYRVFDLGWSANDAEILVRFQDEEALLVALQLWRGKE